MTIEVEAENELQSTLSLPSFRARKETFPVFGYLNFCVYLLFQTRDFRESQSSLAPES